MDFDDHPDWDEVDYELAAVARMVHDDPVRALGATVELAESLPQDRLCQLGVEVLEALLDLHWAVIGQRFEAAAAVNANLRKALSCCGLNIDSGDEARIMSLIRPEENIGRQEADDEPAPSWEQVRDAPVRALRLSELDAMIKAATDAGLPRTIDPDRFSKADPDARHLIWARFRCAPTSNNAPHFYRCAVRFFVPSQTMPSAVAELDVLQADLDALPLVDDRRLVALFKRDSENLPAVDDVTHRS